MVGAAVRDILLLDPNISQYVGTRIYPKEIPLSSALPAISYSIISDPYKQISGFQRVQISVWSEDYTECGDIYKTITDALEGYSGIVNGINIMRIVPIDAHDDYSATTGVYHIPADYKVIFRK